MKTVDENERKTRLVCSYLLILCAIILAAFTGWWFADGQVGVLQAIFGVAFGTYCFVVGFKGVKRWSKDVT